MILCCTLCGRKLNPNKYCCHCLASCLPILCHEHFRLKQSITLNFLLLCYYGTYKPYSFITNGQSPMNMHYTPSSGKWHRQLKTQTLQRVPLIVAEITPWQHDLTDRSALAIQDGLLEFRLLFLGLQDENNTGANDSDDNDGNASNNSRRKTFIKVGLSCESVHETSIQQKVLLLKNLSTIGRDVLDSPLVSFLGGLIIVVLVVLVVLIAVVALIFGNGVFKEFFTCLRRICISVLEWLGGMKLVSKRG